MTSSQSLVELYHLFEKLEGAVKAKQLVLAVVGNALHEIQDEKIKLSEFELDRKITMAADDFLDVAKKTNVA